MNSYGRINWLPVIAVLAVIFVILMVVVIGLDNRQAPDVSAGSQPTESGVEQLTVLSIKDQDDNVLVTTNYCAIKYPYSMSDLVQVETVNEDDRATLRFYTTLNGTKMPLYELIFGGREEMQVGSITVGQYTLPVFVVIHEAMPGLDDSSRIGFIAAQETINDVMVSLKENTNFVPAA